MAKENNEIGDLVKKCKILLLDIEGTTTSISFVKDKLFPYAESNAKSFLESHWDNEDVKEVVAALRKLAAEDLEKSVDGVVAIPGEDAGKDEQIEGLVKNVQWQMSVDRKVGPLKQLQGFIWKLGYDKGDIKGHVFDDVSPALELWRSHEGHKVYIYSSGSVQAQKLLFNKSSAGDMLPLIEGHFDTAVGAKQDAASYAAIAEKIGCKAEEILFLTDIDKEAEAARASGLHTVLVSREGNAPLAAEAAASFPVMHSFEQLALTNKRKPEPQAEEVPAKVPKTDVQDDVKTVSEAEPVTVKANGSAKTNEAMEMAAVENKSEPETMEVEETPEVSAIEAKIESVVATTAGEIESKTAIFEDVAQKDVIMEDATITNASTIDTKQKSSVDKEDAVTKLDTTDNAATVDTGIDKKTAVDVKALIVEHAEAKSSVVEATVKGSTEEEAKVETSMEQPKDKFEAKAKMVDAATLTENEALKVDSEAKVLGTTAVKTKLVDAATETAAIEAVVEETNNKETPAESMETVNVPITKTDKDIAENSPITEAISAVAHATRDVEAHTETKNEDSICTSDAVESRKAESVESEPAAVASEDTDKETGVLVKEALISDSLDELPVVEAESVGNGDVKIAPVVEVVDKAAIVIDHNDIAEASTAETESVSKSKEEKAKPIETEGKDSEAKADEEKVETEPEEPALESQEEVSSIIEVKDITDDKQSLSEVSDIIDDVVPIVEEPTHLEEMEELQNAGDVLEKECDEILSKVQDVTNLDFIPIKPLHTITEEMETENFDSNDMVERILDTEMELNMKPDDIDLNTVQEITEPKLDTDDRIGKVEPGTETPSDTPKVEGDTEEKMEVNSDAEKVTEKVNDNQVKIDEKMETEEITEIENKVVEADENTKPQESKNDTEVQKEEPIAKTKETEPKPECKESEGASVTKIQDTKENNVSQDAKNNDATETNVNGKTNGEATVKLNGDRDNDLKSRLTAENGKEKVNGSNGSAEAEIGQGDNKVEETPDIKVKTAVTAEPIEQPVEA